MKFVIVLCALFALTLAQHHEEHHGVHHDILNLETDIRSKGFKYAFDTSNGIHKDEEGELKGLDKDHDAIVVHGSYSWVDEKTGAKFDIPYVADEYGYQPIVKLPQH